MKANQIRYQLLGAFRASHIPRPPLNSIYTRPPCTHLSTVSFTCRTSVFPRFQQPNHARPFSLSSLIFPKKAKPTPTPQVVASIATIEADADAHPQDPTKQLTLFDALATTKVKPAYDVIIGRWERMCEFVSHKYHWSIMSNDLPRELQDPSNPLIRSDAAFQHYLNALVANGMEQSVNAAVRRRDSLLAGATASTVASLENFSVSQTIADSTSEGTSTVSNTVPPSSTPPSPSQRIANAVLSGQAAQTTTLNLDMAKLAMALNSGGGIPGNPISVTIAEREYSSRRVYSATSPVLHIRDSLLWNTMPYSV